MTKLQLRNHLTCAHILAIGLAPGLMACGSAEGESPSIGSASSALGRPTAEYSSTFLRQWMTNVAFSVKYDRIGPPIAARSFAYAAIAGYEAVVHGMPGYRSLAGQLNELPALPEPDPGKTYDWPTVLAATEGRVVNATYIFPNFLFYEYTSPTVISLGSLEQVQVSHRLTIDGIDPVVSGDSVAYGHALGESIAAWANADHFAETRYEEYEPPTGPGAWVATGYVDDTTKRALLPHFGELRPLAVASADECLPPAPPPFSTDPSSAMYAQAKGIYDLDLALTKEQRETAFYWADGAGSETPPGHWIKITSEQIKAKSLSEAAIAFLGVGAVLFDSAISTWNSKFHYNLLRPETYIHRYINSQWIPSIPTPQFPSYTSGHSGFSGAAASVLTAILGNVPFTDSTKVRAGYEARSYPNFAAAAKDAGDSRLFGGIHYEMDDVAGVALGECVTSSLVARVDLGAAGWSVTAR